MLRQSTISRSQNNYFTSQIYDFSDENHEISVQERSNKYNQRKFSNNHHEWKTQIDREKIVPTVEIVTLLKLFTITSHLRFNNNQSGNFLSTK